jgi:hypothetical protein
MITFPKDTGRSPFPKAGHWRKGTADGHPTAFLVCPQCPTYASLHGTHEIAVDGTVSPSVVCPNCDFHDFVKLEGWAPNA